MQSVAQKLENQIYRLIYPVFSCAADSKNILITGGGGGSNAFGVKNFLQIHLIDERNQTLATLASLDTGDEIPTQLSFNADLKLWSCCLKRSLLVFYIEETSLFRFNCVLKLLV